MKRSDVETLEKIMGLFEGLHKEISVLSKKSPTDGLNKFKLKFVNSALSAANEFLGINYKPLNGFDQFDDDDIPSNSDVTFILATYLEEIERKRADNINTDYSGWYCSISGGEKIRTAPPKKIKEKK